MGSPSELACWAALHAVPGMGPVMLRRVVDRFGSAAAALEEERPDILAGLKGMTRELAEAILGARKKMDWAERTLEVLQRRGVRLVRSSDSAYPAALNDLANPPPLLYMIGDVGGQDRRAVSMVGTTKPSERGRPIAEGFAARLATAGVSIVSGYAHGIDAAAHRGAFNAGGRSILCIPYGIRQFKPRPDFPALAEIAQRGAVVSECPPDQEWTAMGAVTRDRIIAALGRATFVIETRPHGGTMHTVRAAEQLKRPLFALAFRKPPESARGNSILVARGAIPISTFSEVGALIEAAGPPQA